MPQDSINVNLLSLLLWPKLNAIVSHLPRMTFEKWELEFQTSSVWFFRLRLVGVDVVGRWACPLGQSLDGLGKKATRVSLTSDNMPIESELATWCLSVDSLSILFASGSPHPLHTLKHLQLLTCSCNYHTCTVWHACMAQIITWREMTFLHGYLRCKDSWWTSEGCAGVVTQDWPETGIRAWKPNSSVPFCIHMETYLTLGGRINLI